MTSPANAKNCLSVGATQVCRHRPGRDAVPLLAGWMNIPAGRWPDLLSCAKKPLLQAGAASIAHLHCRPCTCPPPKPRLQTANEVMETSAVKYVVWDATVTEGDYASTFK